MFTTVTTCDDNIPSVNLFDNQADVSKALFEHYSNVWREVEAEGEMPSTWEEIRDELQSHDLLRDRHIAHITEHTLFPAFAAA